MAQTKTATKKTAKKTPAKTRKPTGKDREKKSNYLFGLLTDYGNLSLRVANGFVVSFNHLLDAMTKKKTSVHPGYKVSIDPASYASQFDFTLVTPGKRSLKLQVTTRQDNPAESSILVRDLNKVTASFPFTEKGLRDILVAAKLIEK